MRRARGYHAKRMNKLPSRSSSRLKKMRLHNNDKPTNASARSQRRDQALEQHQAVNRRYNSRLRARQRNASQLLDLQADSSATMSSNNTAPMGPATPAERDECIKIFKKRDGGTSPSDCPKACAVCGEFCFLSSDAHKILTVEKFMELRGLPSGSPHRS